MSLRLNSEFYLLRTQLFTDPLLNTNPPFNLNCTAVNEYKSQFLPPGTFPKDTLPHRLLLFYFFFKRLENFSLDLHQHAIVTNILYPCNQLKTEEVQVLVSLRCHVTGAS